jgi:hypothetical protein
MFVQMPQLEHQCCVILVTRCETIENQVHEKVEQLPNSLNLSVGVPTLNVEKKLKNIELTLKKTM